MGGIIDSIEAIQPDDTKKNHPEHISSELFKVITFHEINHSTPEARSKDIDAGVCNEENKLIVKVPGDHIWPLAYRTALRYGDRVTLGLKPEDAKDKAKKDNLDAMIKLVGNNHLAVIDKIWYMKKEARENKMQTLERGGDEYTKLRRMGWIDSVKWSTDKGVN